jgi:hypothetical protein
MREDFQMFVYRTPVACGSGSQFPVTDSMQGQPRGRNIAGTRIREARMAIIPRLTQDQLAGKLATEGIQLDRVAITKIETGVRGIFDYELRGIARVLKVDAGWLLGMDVPANRSPSNPASGRKPR